MFSSNNIEYSQICLDNNKDFSMERYNGSKELYDHRTNSADIDVRRS